MEDLINDTDPELEKLERQAATKQSAASAEDTTEYEDATGDTADLMEEASELLKNNAVLFEFLANQDYCKSITKRDRELMLKQADKIYALAETLDAAVVDLQDDADDDEDEDE